MKNLKDKILTLRNLGKSYTEIVNELKCARSTVCYHCGINQKDKSQKRLSENRKLLKNKLKRSYTRFNCSKEEERGGKYPKTFNFSFKEFESYILSNIPKCYLTGEPIDLSKSQSYALDHIIPRSRGGKNELKNLGLATKRANSAKSDMTLKEFLDFSKKILENFGYTVLAPCIGSDPIPRT